MMGIQFGGDVHAEILSRQRREAIVCRDAHVLVGIAQLADDGGGRAVRTENSSALCKLIRYSICPQIFASQPIRRALM